MKVLEEDLTELQEANGIANGSGISVEEESELVSDLNPSQSQATSSDEALQTEGKKARSRAGSKSSRSRGKSPGSLALEADPGTVVQGANIANQGGTIN